MVIWRARVQPKRFNNKLYRKKKTRRLFLFCFIASAKAAPLLYHISLQGCRSYETTKFSTALTISNSGRTRWTIWDRDSRNQTFCEGGPTRENDFLSERAIRIQKPNNSSLAISDNHVQQKKQLVQYSKT